MTLPAGSRQLIFPLKLSQSLFGNKVQLCNALGQVLWYLELGNFRKDKQVYVFQDPEKTRCLYTIQLSYVDLFNVCYKYLDDHAQVVGYVEHQFRALSLKKQPYYIFDPDRNPLAEIHLKNHDLILHYAERPILRCSREFSLLSNTSSIYRMANMPDRHVWLFLQAFLIDIYLEKHRRAE